MPLKKRTVKRAGLPRRVDFTQAFEKDWQRLSHSGRFNMQQLKEVMLLLVAADAPLPPEWRAHPLKGPWQGHWECHVGGDFLLIWRLEEEKAPGLLVFVRAGTHAELFE